VEFLKALVALLDARLLVTIVALIAADFILGVVVAIKKGEFSLQKLADFIDTSVLYYMGGYLVAGFVGMLIPEIALFVPACGAAISVSLTAGVLAKLKALGLPIPEAISK
jgi:hypothetical protein